MDRGGRGPTRGGAGCVFLKELILLGGVRLITSPLKSGDVFDLSVLRRKCNIQVRESAYSTRLFPTLSSINPKEYGRTCETASKSGKQIERSVISTFRIAPEPKLGNPRAHNMLLLTTRRRRTAKARCGLTEQRQIEMAAAATSHASRFQQQGGWY